MPQSFHRGNDWFVLYGTGGPLSGGSLHLAPLSTIITGNLVSFATNLTRLRMTHVSFQTSTILYTDPYKGMLTPSVLVDITGDQQADIIAAMYNSTVVAIDGSTLQQIWNYSVPNSESLVVPTPAYFNNDNVTDFLIVYQMKSTTSGNTTTQVKHKFAKRLLRNFTLQAYIIDGKTGKPIYEKPFLGTIETEMGGLSLRMSGQGNDMFVFWSSEIACYTTNSSSNASAYSTNQCRNATLVFKLNAMNQYDQPPGFELYNSGKSNTTKHCSFTLYVSFRETKSF